MNKISNLTIIMLSLALAIGLAACNQATSNKPTSTDTTTTTTTSRSGFPSNGATVPVDQITALRWNVVQSGAVSVYDPTLSTSSSTVIDQAKTARLYFCVSFGKNGESAAVNYQLSADEWTATDDSTTPSVVSVPIETIIEKYFGNASNPALTIGETYAWQVSVIDSLGNKVADTSVYTFTVAPPHPSAVKLGHDFQGYYFEWSVPTGSFSDGALVYSYGFNEEPICDFLAAPSATFSSTAAASVSSIEYQGSDGSSAQKRAYRVYASAITGLTFAADTNYSAKVLVRDKGQTVSTTGEIVKLHSDTVLDNGITLGSVKLAAAAPLTIANLAPTIIFDSIKNASADGAFAVDGDYSTYKLYLGASAATLAKVEAVVSAASTIGNINYGTTYFIQLRAVRGTDNAEVAGPVLQFTTPSFKGGTVYDFGATILPQVGTAAADPAQIGTSLDYTTTDMGYPFPSLGLTTLNGGTIETTMAEPMNPYKKATLKFNFKFGSDTANGFQIQMYNDNSASTFNPFSYSVVAPSSLYATLRGLAFAVRYFGTDPHTAGSTTPVFNLYAYEMNGVNTVDTDVNTAGSQYDADIYPDVSEKMAGSVLPNVWYTLTITVALDSNTASVVLSDGTTTTTTNVSTALLTLLKNGFTGGPNINSVANLGGMDKMIITAPASNTVYIDNLSYSVDDSSYTRGL
jgi:hypothetical protein